MTDIRSMINILHINTFDKDSLFRFEQVVFQIKCYILCASHLYLSLYNKTNTQRYILHNIISW